MVEEITVKCGWLGLGQERWAVWRCSLPRQTPEELL